MFRCPFGRNQPKISRCQIACSRCKLPTVQQVGRPAASEGSTFTEVAINTEIGILRTVWFDLPGMWCRSPHLSVGTTGNCTVFQRNWIHHQPRNPQFAASLASQTTPMVVHTSPPISRCDPMARISAGSSTADGVKLVGTVLSMFTGDVITTATGFVRVGKVFTLWISQQHDPDARSDGHQPPLLWQSAHGMSMWVSQASLH